MAVETWVAVSGHENEYEVSTSGRVRSLSRFRAGKNGTPVRVDGRILKQSLMGSGYPAVSLGKTRRAYVHRLVAAAFVPNPGDLREVNHVDGDKRNPTADNLEWVSRDENMCHASRSGLLATGVRHGRHTKPEAFRARR